MPLILDVVGPRQGTAPLTYTLAELGTVDIQSVFAHFDGAGASGAWVPALTIRSQNGAIISRTSPDTPLAVSDTSDVTFAPFLRGDTGTRLLTTDGVTSIDPTDTLTIGSGLTLTNPTTGEAKIVAAGGGGGGFNALAEGFGLLAWTTDPALADVTFRPSTKTVLSPIWLAAGTVVTSLGSLYPTVEVVPPTHVYYAIYNASFARVGLTADTPSVCNVAGFHTLALTASYTVPADGLHYIGGLYDPATQTPTHVSSVINYAAPVAFPSGQFRTPQVNALTSFPATFVPTSGAANTPAYFAL